MKSDIGAMKAYMRMILDGTAFSNWKNPPDSHKRSRLVESIMEGKSFDQAFVGRFKSAIVNEDEEQIKRLLDSMEIKESEFSV